MNKNILALAALLSLPALFTGWAQDSAIAQDAPEAFPGERTYSPYPEEN